jgi:hypothetical protein
MAIALPLVVALRRRARFASVGVPAMSVAIALAGACWFVVRALA